MSHDIIKNLSTGLHSYIEQAQADFKQFDELPAPHLLEEYIRTRLQYAGYQIIKSSQIDPSSN